MQAKAGEGIVLLLLGEESVRHPVVKFVKFLKLGQGHLWILHVAERREPPTRAERRQHDVKG